MMISEEMDNIIGLRFFPGEKLLDELKNACVKHDVNSAIVLSGVGQLKKINLGFFTKDKRYSKDSFEDPLELLNLTGNIVKDKNGFILHLHAVLGDKNKKLVGGHFFAGEVEITCEVFLLKTKINAYRKIDDNGLKSLFFR